MAPILISSLAVSPISGQSRVDTKCAVLPGAPELCPTSQHSVAHQHCQALVDVASLACILELTELNITTGNSISLGPSKKAKAQQDQETSQKIPPLMLWCNFMSRFWQPKLPEEFGLTWLLYAASHEALLVSSSKMRMTPESVEELPCLIYCLLYCPHPSLLPCPQMGASHGQNLNSTVLNHKKKEIVELKL